MSSLADLTARVRILQENIYKQTREKYLAQTERFINNMILGSYW